MVGHRPQRADRALGGVGAGEGQVGGLATLHAIFPDRTRQETEIQSRWTPDQEYLPPPETGDLAALDPALIVTPPEGLGPGCVPIATRQSSGE
jgi:hypothetical protein